MAAQWRVSNGQREWLVTVDGTSVTVEGVDGEFVVMPRPDGRWSITHADQVSTASAARADQSIWTEMDGAGTEWQAHPASSRARHRVVDDSIRSPMSATVVSVHVTAGSAVAEGDPLVVVEAMKMEMPLRAPSACVVKAVHCQVGELVQPTTVLVELE